MFPITGKFNDSSGALCCKMVIGIEQEEHGKKKKPKEATLLILAEMCDGYSRRVTIAAPFAAVEKYIAQHQAEDRQAIVDFTKLGLGS